MVILAPVGRLPIFVRDRVVLLSEMKRGFLLEVLPLALHRLVRLGQESHGLTAAVAAFLAAGYPALGGSQAALRLALAARVVNHRAIGQGRKGCSPSVDPGFLPGGREWLHRPLGACATGVPAVRLFGDRDGLGYPIQWTAPPDGEAANLGEHLESTWRAPGSP